ncbi:hypothetical protein DITRI_Ditri15bG0042200 [Diplodiscus trichospermus]
MSCGDYVNGEADNNPFSIRQFVVASRRKDIFHCWPFPQKYLQICLKHGIDNVLPPFEPCNPAVQTTTTCSQQDKENVSFENKARDIIVQEKLIEDQCNSDYDEVISKAPCHDCREIHLDNSCKHKDESNFSSDYTSNYVRVQINQKSSSHLYVHQRINTVSPKKLRHKKRKHKGRQKKRSMVDILANATPCSLDDLYRRCNLINLSDDVDESTSRLMAHVEDINDDDEASHDNLSNKKSTRVLKIKFDGCISKSWNIN